MVQLIMGLKGSGKTKRLVDLVRAAVDTESGSVVCIEKDKKLTYDIPPQARLVFASDYAIGTAEFFKGLLSGLHAGNYDITHIFIDNFTKLIPGITEAEIVEFVQWINVFSEKEGVKFTISLSVDPDTAPAELNQYKI